jgi:hypothetical protein
MPGYRFKEAQTFNLSERLQSNPFPIEQFLNQNVFFSVAAALSMDMSRFSARTKKSICKHAPYYSS